MKQMKINNEKGITLIALIVTIIVLLILAGITITLVLGDHGILEQAMQAKIQTEIASEKEIVKLAATKWNESHEGIYITKDELQNDIQGYTKESTEVLLDGQDLYVHFIDNDRYYIIDSTGNVDGPVTVNRAEDQYPGDITKDKNGNILTGTSKEDAYQINCIEDLCAFSNSVDNTTQYNNKYIVLMRDLDFKSIFSYIDGSISVEGDIPSCNSKEELMQWLTQKEGFISIGKANGIYFRGKFNGNYYTISNFYKTYTENSTVGIGGLFGYCRGGEIINLTVKGDIIVPSHAAGIVVCAENTIITNCVSKVNLTTNNGWLGGIVSFAYGQAVIKNCINYGNIGNGQFTGGILGWDWSANSIISNCVNTGNVVNGIIGTSGSQTQAINCVNYGMCTTTPIGSPQMIENSFYLNGSAPESTINNVVAYDEQYMKSEEFVNELNSFITTDASSLNIDTKGFAKWVYKENEFPIFNVHNIWNGTEWE